MNELVPVAEWIGREYGNMYPYNNSNINEILNHFNIKLPFNLTDKATGMSTCSNCGARYAGYQDKCENKDYFYTTGGYSNSTRYKNKKDAAKRASSYYPLKEGWMVCETKLDWDYQEEWNRQELFFEDMCRIYDIDHGYIDTFSPAEKHRDVLPIGTAEALEKKAMIQEIQELKATIDSHKAVLQEIADRMQNAGATLLNGGF